MPNRQPEFFIIDILITIDKIKRRIKNLSFQDFLSNEDAVDATLRNLEIIGEATSQILKNSNFLEETSVDWRKIVNFRNVIIHFYFGINLDLIFNQIAKKKDSTTGNRHNQYYETKKQSKTIF